MMGNARHPFVIKEFNVYLSSFLPFGATNPRPAKIDNTAGVNTVIFMVILIYFNILFFTYSIILFGVSISS